jgi:hypothetical protein
MKSWIVLQSIIALTVSNVCAYLYVKQTFYRCRKQTMEPQHRIWRAYANGEKVRSLPQLSKRLEKTSKCTVRILSLLEVSGMVNDSSYEFSFQNINVGKVKMEDNKVAVPVRLCCSTTR